VQPIESMSVIISPYSIENKDYNSHCLIVFVFPPTFKNNKVIIIIGDLNINILNCSYTHTSNYISALQSKIFVHTITSASKLVNKIACVSPFLKKKCNTTNPASYKLI